MLADWQNRDVEKSWTENWGHRWLPDRTIVLVADSAFAAIEFLAARL